MRKLIYSLLLFATVFSVSGCNTMPEKDIDYSRVGNMKIWITPEYSSAQDANNFIYTSIIQ